MKTKPIPIPERAWARWTPLLILAAILASCGGGVTPKTERPSMRWTIGPDDFRSGLQTSGDPSEPYEWDLITAGNVRISIGGKELTATGGDPPALTSTSHAPAFDSDLTGAEWTGARTAICRGYEPDLTGADWTVTAEVRTGAVVLVLTAPYLYNAGPVLYVHLTNGGSGYASPPAVTFGAGGDSDATGVAVGPGMVTGVTVTDAGTGYLSPPAITFTGGGGADAAATAVVSEGSVVDVIITNGGSGYTATPNVVFTAPPSGSSAIGVAVVERSVTSVMVTHGAYYRKPPPVTFDGGGGSGAAGFAVLPYYTIDDWSWNLCSARQTLYGKELLVEITGE